ncbi:MAG: hypothetical protein ACI8TQ_002903 [Planctomycetota bacterium]|jgi:hypothetical protein
MHGLYAKSGSIWVRGRYCVRLIPVASSRFHQPIQILTDRSLSVMHRSIRSKVLSLCFLAIAVAGCGSDSVDPPIFFILQGARGAVDTTLPTTVVGDWLVYFEDEGPLAPAVSPGNLNSNGPGTDVDSTDSVAVAIRVSTGATSLLGVAARSAHIIGDEIYLEVSEVDDNFDWNGDGTPDDLVLLHWSERLDGVANGIGMCNAAGVCYVDDLDPAVTAPAVLAITVIGRVYYTSGISNVDLAALPDGSTSLNMLETANPMMPIVVTHTSTGKRRPRIVSTDINGLLVLVYDENVEMLDLNAGDSDGTDVAILALLDATNPTTGIKSVERAMPLRTSLVPPAYSPVVSTLNSVTNELLVGFLVSENDEATLITDSLNDRDSAEFTMTAWEPTQCATQDTDVADSVLHFVHFDTWFNNSMMNPPRNTGLVGRLPGSTEPDRIVVLNNGYIGIVSDEQSAACDLNMDTDMSDGVVRWAEAPLDPMINILPPGAVAELHALEISVPGPTEGLSSMGFAELHDRFVIVVDETNDADDIDGDGGMTSDLVGWLDPASSTKTTWTFAHGNGFIGAGWMGEDPRSSRLLIAFQESVVNASLNSACKSLTLVNDTDFLDELPVFGQFSADSILFAPGVGVATAPGNPGIVIEGGVTYFRASEAAHNQDLNGDGDKSDFIAVRNSLTACAPVAMAVTTNPASGDGVLITDGGASAAIIGSEADSGIDFNNNGNVGEEVLLFFRIP